MSTPASTVFALLLQKIHKVTEVHFGTHVVYTSGRHGSGYVNYRNLGRPEHKDLLKQTAIAVIINGLQVAGLPLNTPITVVGPRTLGAQMTETLREAVSQGEHLPFNDVQLILLERDSDALSGFKWENEGDRKVIDEDNRILIWIDDLFNQGSTLEKGRTLVESDGNRIMIVAVIGDRSGKSAKDFDVAFLVSLEQFNLTVEPEESCSLCAQGVPIARHPGHGHKFEQERPDYPGGYIDKP